MASYSTSNTPSANLLKRTTELSSITSIRSETDDHWFSVLSLCHQRNPSHFGLEFPSTAYENFEYLDSGTYSHVIKACDCEQDNMPIVFKIIKVVQRSTLNHLSDVSLKGFEMFTDVYQEIVIMKLLSNLHDTVADKSGFEYQTHSYPRIIRTRVVNGEIPNYFLIRSYNESARKIKPVERFDDTFGVPREHLVVVMKFGGDSLWDRIQASHPELLKPDQLLSVCYQVSLALAIAEIVYQFEHRDLHVCNLLVKPTKKAYILFKIRSVEYRVKSYGIKTCIIDATFSRMSLGGVSYFTDLTSRLKSTAENPKPEGHEVAYAQMYRLIGDRWSSWFPESNVIWLKCVFTELFASDAFESHADQHQRAIIRRLIAMVTDYKTVYEFVQAIFNESGDIVSNDRIQPPQNVKV
ncbi:Serine/threonine-protein kinase haspin [Blomia tropicalis]|nr:Serine/threonine-protein kinase haspin [Blomia tropicalis]